MLSSVFILQPATKRSPKDRVPWYDWILALASLPAGLWITVNYPGISAKIGMVSPERLIFGSIAVILLLEAIRRMLGKAIFIILLIFLFYGKFSSLFPGMLAGTATTWTRYVNYLYLDASSILYMLSLAANIGIAFVFFSQVLLVFGGSDGMTEFAFIAFGRTRGGPAKAAVVGSSLVGTVSGAPMSNVFLTGSVTIPMMIKSGWRREVAGAVEAVASSGGSIMPPVMGIAAFLIAERLGVSYSTVCLAALIPAVLFYIAVFIQVDLYAGKHKLLGLKRSELPNPKETVKKSWPLIPIFALLLYLLFFDRMAAARAAVITSILALPLMACQKKNRENFFRKCLEVLIGGGKMALNAGCALAAGGIITGVVAFSGLGFTMGYVLTELGNIHVMVLLLGTAIGAIILGMGMPAVAAYALTAALLASSIQSFGIPEMAAHMFIFYFSVISNITPPIALAVFAACILAKSDFWKTGWEACKLGILAYIIPFLFVFSPSLLMQGNAGEIFLSFITAAAGALYIGISLTGYLFRLVPKFQRLILFISGFGALIPVTGNTVITLINLVGVFGGFAIIMPQVLFERSRKKQLNEKVSQ